MSGLWGRPAPFKVSLVKLGTESPRPRLVASTALIPDDAHSELPPRKLRAHPHSPSYPA